MTGTDSSLWHEWHYVELMARSRDFKPIGEFLRSYVAEDSPIDFKRLADVLDRQTGPRKRGPIPDADPYLSAMAGKPDSLIALLENDALSGDIPDLLFIASLLKKRNRGRPNLPRIRTATRGWYLFRAVERYLHEHSKTSLDNAFNFVAEAYFVSSSQVAKAFYSQSKLPFLYPSEHDFSEEEEIKVGDTISHELHGEGTIVELVKGPLPSNWIVTVHFKKLGDMKLISIFI